MSIPYKWLCTFKIINLWIPENSVIDDIHFKNDRQGTVGNFTLETEPPKPPEDESIEKANLLADAAAVKYGFREVQIEEPVLSNEAELRAAGQCIPLTVSFPLPVRINGPSVNASAIEQILKNLKNAGKQKEVFVLALRWIRKARIETYPVDKFIAYWIAFNALYNCTGESGEKKYIKAFIQKEFDDEDCENLFRSISDSDINTIANSGLRIDWGKTEIANDLKDAYLTLSHNKKYKKCLELLALSIYAARNELFHGGVKYEQHNQLALSCYGILSRIVSHHLTKNLVSHEYGNA